VARAFVAVRVPEAVLDAIANSVTDLPAPGRRTRREQWHLTLQFLGNDADVDAVAAALDGIVGPPALARVGGAGAFPDARGARVLWLGLTQGVELLTRLAEAVADRTLPLGHDGEARPFRPHLTLARYRVPTDVRPTIVALGDAAIGPSWEVDSVTVYESRLHSSGAEYVERATIPVRPSPLSS
jgi:RNA 2',3'-cyclic 3'-phosphodiesterase